MSEKFCDFVCPFCHRVTVAISGASISCSRSLSGVEHAPKLMKEKS